MRELVVDAGQVGTVTGVDLQNVAGFDEQRHLNLSASLQSCRLGATGGAVALQTRVGLRDGEIDGDGQLGEERLALVEGHLAGGFRKQELSTLRHLSVQDGNLVVGLVVHEDVSFTVVVQVRHVAAVDGSSLNLDASVESLVNNLAGQNVLQLGADECRTLTWLDVLELHDLLKLIVVLDN